MQISMYTIDNDGYFTFAIRTRPNQPERVVCYGFDYIPEEKKFLRYLHYTDINCLLVRVYDTSTRN